MGAFGASDDPAPKIPSGAGAKRGSWGASSASQLTVRTRSPGTAHPSTAVSSGALLMMTSTSVTDVSLNAISTAVEALA